MSPQTVLGQPSWRIATPDVEAFVTVAGGHLGPVRFRLGDRTVEPFSVAPWCEEPLGRSDVQMLHSLRGDFFCMPFGGNETPYLPSSSPRGEFQETEDSQRAMGRGRGWGNGLNAPLPSGGEGPGVRGSGPFLSLRREEGVGDGESEERTARNQGQSGGVDPSERHPQHGDTANLDWTLRSLSDGEITLELKTETRPGKVEKHIRIEGTSIYQSHTISGMAGPMCFGHHAMLRFPTEGRLSTSAIQSGRVFPDTFELPENGGYTFLLPGATFENLTEVPLANGGTADLTRYPAREGFEDLVQIYDRPEGPFAWNAVVVDGYLWLALKDPRTLPSTVLWHSNGGRHYAPWNGRHRRVLGVEDVCAYFHYGLAESAAPNDAPVPTFLNLDPAKLTEIRYAMVIAPVPEGFGIVTNVEPAKASVTVSDDAGLSIPVEIDWSLVTGSDKG